MTDTDVLGTFQRLGKSRSVAYWSRISEILFSTAGCVMLIAIVLAEVEILRLLVSLKSTQTQEYETSYYYHLQGLIYNAIRDSEYGSIHDRPGNKFFCFSNIFPVGPLSPGDRRKLLISSPDAHLITCIVAALDKNRKITIGRMRFILEELRELKLGLRTRTYAMTSTPLVVRIRREKCEELGIRPPGNHPDVYWRIGFPVDLLRSEISDNLEKKFREWYKIPGTMPTFNFEQCLRQVAVPIVSKSYKETVIGTLWKFSIQADDEDQLKAAELAFDTGLGDRNPLGFGFINVL